MDTITRVAKPAIREEARLHIPPKEGLRKALLVCGILSSLWYAAINVLVPAYYPGYTINAQTISELSAIGSPTRELWNILVAPFPLLILAFGYGIRLSAGSDKRLKTAGALFIASALISFFWSPMHQRTVLAAGGSNWSDTIHIVMGVLTEIMYLFTMGYAMAALGGWFRWYTIITLAVLVFFGYLMFRDMPAVSKNLPTPWLGIKERINIGAFDLWIIVLSLRLLPRKD